MDDPLDLTTVDGLAAALRSEAPGSDQSVTQVGTFNGTFCPSCGDVRRMGLIVLFWEDRWAAGGSFVFGGEPREYPPAEHPSPAMYLLACVQCEERITVVVHEGPSGIELVPLPSTYGGLATPNTPAAVAYYLDQAQRSQSVGALSGAVSMYRSAAESLLFEQGYEDRMLGPKIKALTEDDTPPSWRDELDEEYFTVLNKLGNAALHPNEGDIKKQAVFEAQLVREVQSLFAELLDVIYERPRKRDVRLAKLKEAIGSFAERKDPDGTDSA